MIKLFNSIEEANDYIVLHFQLEAVSVAPGNAIGSVLVLFRERVSQSAEPVVKRELYQPVIYGPQKRRGRPPKVKSIA